MCGNCKGGCVVNNINQLRHNCMIQFSFGVGDIQYRHILITGGKVRAYDITMDYYEFASTDTLLETVSYTHLTLPTT